MISRTRTWVMWGIAAALVATGGCRSASQDRIRVLEAERADLTRENDRLKNDLAGERGKGLEASARADALEAERRAGLRAGGEVSAGQTDELTRKLTADGVDARKRSDGSTAVMLASDITFGAGRADLTSGAQKVLQRVAQAVKASPDVGSIRVEGHTDSDPIKKSGWASNEELSKARAESVRRFLVTQGIEENLLSVEGLGASQPVAPNTSPTNKAKNRRVEVVLVPTGK